MTEQGLRELAQGLHRAQDEAGAQPQAQIVSIGLAYRAWALQHPQLYRLLFAGRPLNEEPSVLEQNRQFLSR